MSNGIIQLPPDSNGKKLRTRTSTEDGSEVHDEFVRVSNSSGTEINPATEDGNLATIAGDTTSIDSKITACNTGAIVGGVKIIDTNGVLQGILIEDGSITTRPYYVAISEGDIANHVSWERFGLNSDIDITQEDIWAQGGTYVFPTAEMQMELVSSSGSDDVGSTGINTVTLYYLDDAFTEKTEDINLDGTNVVTTTATDIYRVNSLKAKVVGTGGVAAGNIVIRHLNNTPIYSGIEIGNTRSRNSIYTVPVGKTLHITSAYHGCSSTSANNGATITMKANYDHDASVSRTFFLPHSEISLGSAGAGVLRVYEIPITFPAGTDIKASATSLANNCSVNISMRGWLQTE